MTLNFVLKNVDAMQNRWAFMEKVGIDFLLKHPLMSFKQNVAPFLVALYGSGELPSAFCR